MPGIIELRKGKETIGHYYLVSQGGTDGVFLLIQKFFQATLLCCLFFHSLRCMLDHQSANGLLAALTSTGTKQMGLVRHGESSIGLKGLDFHQCGL